MANWSAYARKRAAAVAERKDRSIPGDGMGRIWAEGKDRTCSDGAGACPSGRHDLAPYEAEA